MKLTFLILIVVILMSGCGQRHPFTDVLPPHPPPPIDPAPRLVEPVSKATTRQPTPDSTPPIPESIPTAPTLYRPTLVEAVDSVNGQLEDIFFDYDHNDLSAAARAALEHDTQLLRAILRDFPALRIVVEGHCDERGSAEYNLGLGDRRASSVIEYLRQFDLPAAVFAPISYGKERPLCTEAAESCWRRNRRVHLAARVPETE